MPDGVVVLAIAFVAAESESCYSNIGDALSSIVSLSMQRVRKSMQKHDAMKGWSNSIL